MFRDLKLKMKLAFAFSTLLAMMATVGLLGWRYNRNLSKQFEALYKDSVQSTVFLKPKTACGNFATGFLSF